MRWLRPTLLHDDHATRLIIKHFIQNYIDAQHSLEWSELAGGATFEIILTALLAVVKGGVGVIASLGTQARKLSQMKKLGELFSELAELLKKVPKAKVLTMRKEKERAEQKERKKPLPPKKQDKTESINDDTMHKGSLVPVKTLVATDITPKKRLGELTSEELELVDNVSTFKTKGVSHSVAENWLINHPEGQEYFEVLRESV